MPANACDLDDGLIQPLFVEPGEPPVLRWRVEPGVSGYNLYRGLLSTLSSANYGDCIGPGLTQTQVLLGDTDPAVGDGFFYLVTAFSVLGEGTLGFDGGGTERVITNPCP